MADIHSKKDPPHPSGIAYQNKDISSKYFAEEFKDTFFKAFGLDLPDIVSVEPTELPAIEVNDMEMDKLYHLADGSYAIVDYESSYNELNKVKYIGYVARLFKRVYNQNKVTPHIRVIIIYTADVKKGETNPILDLGADRLELTEAFLSDFNAEEILFHSSKKITNGNQLTDEEKLKLMLCPLAVIGKTGKTTAVNRAIKIIAMLNSDAEQKTLLSGLLAFCDKVISQKDLDEIRRIIRMTKFEKMIYDEKQEAVKSGIHNDELRIAKNMLSDGFSVEKVIQLTGLDKSAVENLANSLQDNLAMA